MLNLHIHKQILMVFAGYDKMLNKKKLTKIHWNSYAFCYLGLTNVLFRVELTFGPMSSQGIIIKCVTDSIE